MHPSIFDPDSLEFDLGLGEEFDPDFLGATGDSAPASYQEPGYEGTIDYRIRQLSYSSILSLHACPRKFQLYKLRASSAEGIAPIKSTSVTFAYGHAIGTGIQRVLEGWSEDQILWEAFQNWDVGLFDYEEKSKKSFWEAILAIQQFRHIRTSGILKDYDVVYYQGKPANELSFCINFPDGFRYRGFVDSVLRHRDTGKVLVLECKTTGLKVLNPAMYKNSAQAIGYSIVLDVIFPEISSYDVLYFVYQSQSREFSPIPFTKTYLQRALWIRELLLDIEQIKSYEQAEVYPMHGESCYNYYRECEYLNTCTLNTKYLTKPMNASGVDKTEYEINVDLLQVLEAQLGKE